MRESLRVLHITDTHLFADKSVSKNGVNTYRSFCEVLDQALIQDTPDLVLGGGDIAQESMAVTYEHFRNALSERSDCELLCVLGNHDAGQLFRQCLPTASHESQHWNVIALDTHIDHTVSGRVSPEDIENLKHELGSSTKHKLVVGHHPLIEIGVPWMDAHRVANGDEVMDLLKWENSVRAYLSGHVHQEFHAQTHELETFTTPSTCWQFATDSPNFAIDALPPGWRWLTLNQDGTIQSHVSRLRDETHEHTDTH